MGSVTMSKIIPRSLLQYWFEQALVVALVSVLCCVSFVLLPNDSFAQDNEAETDEKDKALIDRRPFDRIYLDDFNKNEIMEVEELNSKTSLIPADNKPTDLLQFQFLWDPIKWYTVPWKNVVKVETYPEILLVEVRKLLNDKAPSKRADNLAKVFKFLDRILNDPKYRNDSRAQEYLREYLYEDAYFSFKSKQFREAWTALDELFFLARDYRPSSEVPSVVDMLSDLIGSRIGKMVNSRDYRSAESLMDTIRSKYGRSQAAVIKKWQDKIYADAEVEREKARIAYQEKNARNLHDAVRSMLNINPKISGGQAMFERTLEEFPLVFVGVTDKAATGDPASLLSWAERRKGRLFYRSIVEYSKQGQDGGIYRFPHGDIVVADDAKSMQFAFRSDLDEPALPEMDAYSLRKRLLDLADPTKPDFSPVWAELIKSTYAQDPKVLTIELTQPHVRPEALLQVNHSVFDEKNPPAPDAYYVEEPSDDAGTLYVPNPKYPQLKERKLPQIVEVFYPDATAQTDALLRGDLDVVDRVFPADIRRLRRNDEIDVHPYTIPTIHVLIPNVRLRHMKSTIFRTALLYGIDRQKILQDGILGGQSISGFRVISGCVPYGVTDSDPIGYGYNSKVPPLIADPRIGLVQAVVADGQVKQLLEKLELEDEFVELKKLELKLCHPSNDFARAACELIKVDLEVIGVKVKLVELKPGETYPPGGDFDLLYSEITMQEPLLDIRRILAPEGLAKTNNDAVNQAIRFLDTAKSWRDAGPRLHELHDLCFNNSLVLPLWQVVEHYAYRKNVRGVGKKINTLYKNVVDWKISAGNTAKE